MENAVANVDTPEEALVTVRAKLKEMVASQNFSKIIK
jgi:hypothetical protein